MARRRRTQRTSISPRSAVLLIAVLLLFYLYENGTFDRLLTQFGFPPARPPEVATAPPQNANDAIQVFFNTPDLVYPDASARRGSSPVLQAVVADLSAAKTSIDVAAFDFDLPQLTDALLQARQRGVVVRMIVDSENLADPDVADQTGRLQQADVPITFQRTDPFMHNKFIVIDEIVTWTGSMNMTTNGVYRNNNNFQRLVNGQISADYSAEFGQMFGGQFGSGKARLTRYPRVQVGAATVEVYFSPQDGIAKHVLERINDAQHSIRFLTFSFTSDPIAGLMVQKQAQGVHIQGVFEARNVSGTGSDFERLRQGGISVLPDGNCYVMHHKVIIIDDRTVITGSYNFTKSAESYNDENLLIIDDPAVAQQYLAEYQRVYAQAQAPQRCG